MEFQKTIPIREYDRLSRAIQLLTLKKPAVVAKFLLSFTDPLVKQDASNNSSEMYWIKRSGYYYTSFFGHLYSEDRIKYLTPLLDAKDPFVQAAAAIYLSFDQPEKAISRLKEKAELPDVPGAWVALALVRRGYAEYMPQALTFYQPFPSYFFHIAKRDSRHIMPGNQSRIYTGPWMDLESMLSKHIDYLSEKYILDPLTLPYLFGRDPWNEQGDAQQQLNYEAALQWWEKNKSVIQDTRDPLIDEWIAQRID